MLRNEQLCAGLHYALPKGNRLRSATNETTLILVRHTDAKVLGQNIPDASQSHKDIARSRLDKS